MTRRLSAALIIASQTRGWDPTEIPGSPGTLANFDKNPGDPIPPNPLGTLPEGIHDTYKDGYDVPNLSADQSPTWTCPDFSREMKDRRTNGADTISGQGPGGRQ